MLVSIVVPIYNTGREILSRCIDSLLRQTYSDLEILLVDDGSTDESGEVCNEYAQEDNRIRVFHKSNGGEASARNAGLELCTGDFVGFCDSDDEFTVDAVRILIMAGMGDEDLSFPDLVVGAYLEKTGEITRIAVANKEHYTPYEAAIEVSLDTSAYSTCYIFSTVNGKLFRSDIIRKHHIRFQEFLKVGNDTIFVRDFFSQCTQIKNAFLPTYVYYKYDVKQRKQGISWLYPDWFLFLCHVWKKDMGIIQGNPNCSDEDLRAVHQRFIDALIGNLVRAAAYESSFPYPLEPAMAKVIQSDLISQSIPHYRPTRLSDSVRISQCILEKDIQGLMQELKARAGNYIKTHGKQNSIRFIYPDNIFSDTAEQNSADLPD